LIFSHIHWWFFKEVLGAFFETYDETFELVENENGYKINWLRNDHGEYFFSNDFNIFYAQHGIKRQLTIAYIPQWNGLLREKREPL